MDTHIICQDIKREIPETKNYPQLMNSFMSLLSELNKVVMRINEATGTNRLSIEVKIEEK